MERPFRWILRRLRTAIKMTHRLAFPALCFVSYNLGWCAESANSWRLSTDDTAIVVAAEQRSPVVTHLGSPRTKFNWLAAPVPEKLLPTVMQRGSSLTTDWKYTGG